MTTDKQRGAVPEGLEEGERTGHRFQRSMWRVQRISWTLLGAFLLAAAVGLAGGRLSHAVLRPLAIYAGIFLLLRMSGKHSLGEITTFDFVLLLIISESVSSALLAGDNSIVSALVAAATLVFADILLSLLQRWFPRTAPLLEDEPIILLAHGKLYRDRLHAERVEAADILEAARRIHGLERMDQIRFAVLERPGDISIIPEREG